MGSVRQAAVYSTWPPCATSATSLAGRPQRHGEARDGAAASPAGVAFSQVGDKEITLDDMWALDVQKLDGWQLVRENTVGEEVFKQAAAGAGGDDDSDWTDASDEEEG